MGKKLQFSFTKNCILTVFESKGYTCNTLNWELLVGVDQSVLDQHLAEGSLTNEYGLGVLCARLCLCATVQHADQSFSYLITQLAN